MTRRAFSAGLGALGMRAMCLETGRCFGAARILEAAQVAKAEAGGSETLRALAAARGLVFGSVVNVPALAADAEYARLVRTQAAAVSAARAMDWAALEPEQGAYRWEQADALIAFAEAAGLQVRGGSLCGVTGLPAWIEKLCQPAGCRGLLESYIRKVAGRYAGRIHTWDAVGEAICVADGRVDGMRNSVWLRGIGEDFVELAFHAAREADPEALLAYRETGLAAEDDASRRKRVAVLLLLRRMRARGVPVDALSLVSRLRPGEVYGTGLARFLEQVAELGLTVDVAELTVERDRAGGDPASTLNMFLARILRERSVRAVTVADLEERLAQDSAPFAGNGRPAPMYYALRSAFAGVVRR